MQQRHLVSIELVGLDCRLIMIAELKPASSWIGRWWTRKETDSPAPVKANLGDQMSLVYDKELKRWVNPNVGLPNISFISHLTKHSRPPRQSLWLLLHRLHRERRPERRPAPPALALVLLH